MDDNIIKYDLNNCEKEPTHLIGKIQNVGYFISVSKLTFKVTFVSNNIFIIFNKTPETLFGTDIHTLFDKEFIQSLNEFLSSTKKHYSYNKLILLNNNRYQIFFSDSNDYINLEFQLIENINEYYDGVSDGFKFIDDSINIFSTYDEEKSLAQSATSILRKYTGFDKVMVYKFDENDNGEVIAEDRGIGIKSYLGLKFPASDIPNQARALYVLNKVRAIYDSMDEGIDIISNNTKIEVSGLDLTYSLFRSVSPTHLEYLRNMKVRASHSISLVVNNKLWGLIVCHQYNESKFLRINQRLNSQIFGDLLSNRISIIESLEQFENTKLLTSLTNEFRYDNKKIGQVISDLWNPLSTLFKCNGVFYKENNYDFTMNEPLERRCIDEINRIYRNNKEPIISTNSLRSIGFKSSNIFPYSGMLRITISENEGKYFYLFRYEKVKNIIWAGDPNSNVEILDNDFYSIGPRKSFESWAESVRDCSEDWTTFELSCANIIRDALIRFDIHSNKINYLANETYKLKKEEIEITISKKTQELESQHLKLIKEIEHQDEIIDTMQFAKIMSEYMFINQNDLFIELTNKLNIPIKNFNELKSYLSKTQFSKEINEIIDNHLSVANKMIDTINHLIDLTKNQESDNIKLNLQHEIISLRNDLSKKKY